MTSRSMTSSDTTSSMSDRFRGSVRSPGITRRSRDTGIEPGDSAIRDIETGRSFLPDGPFTERHTEYALAARFVGPVGNNIVILTPGTRNSGMLQIIRMLTTTEGLADLQKKLDEQGHATGSFEALLSVTSFRETDVAGELLAVHPLPHPKTQAAVFERPLAPGRVRTSRGTSRVRPLPRHCSGRRTADACCP